ncbi:MAG: Gfo/Idh/MocA family protein [Candidatus Bathyarchaeales archaeon]
MSKINVAIVGCGYVANDHFKAWQKVKEARIVAISDLNEKVAKKAAENWKVPLYYSNLTDLLANTEVDVVDICTPPQFHANLAVETMKSGVNVLIEKPMAMTVKDAEKIVKCQKDTKVKASVIHNWLFDYPILKASSIVEGGKLGEIYSFEVEALSTKYDLMSASEKHWCHTLPGGRFSEMLVHPVYLVRHFLTGEPTIADVEVSKVGSYEWMKSDELCTIFKVGRKFGRAYVSFNSPRDEVYINIYGSKGILKIELINAMMIFLPAREVSRFKKGLDSIRQAWQYLSCATGNAWKVILRKWQSGHDLYIKLFADSLINDADPPVSVEDGLATVKLLEEICKRIVEHEMKSSI